MQREMMIRRTWKIYEKKKRKKEGEANSRKRDKVVEVHDRKRVPKLSYILHSPFLNTLTQRKICQTKNTKKDQARKISCIGKQVWFLFHCHCWINIDDDTLVSDILNFFLLWSLLATLFDFAWFDIWISCYLNPSIDTFFWGLNKHWFLSPYFMAGFAQKVLLIQPFDPTDSYLYNFCSLLFQQNLYCDPLWAWL